MFAVGKKFIQSVICQKPNRGKVATGSIVLVQGVDRHAIGRGVGGFCQCSAPLLVTIVANPRPVHRAQDDGLLVWHNQYQADGVQGLDNFTGGLDPPVAEGATQWWCGVGTEGGQTDRIGSKCNEGQQQGKKAGDAFHVCCERNG